MGNSPSSAAIGPLCAHPVTAHPTVARLTDRDVRNLNQLYGHDDELLQLMCAAELLRDYAKSAGDACALHFHHAFVDAKHERAFGEKLKEAAGRLNASGLAALVPAREADAQTRPPRTETRPRTTRPTPRIRPRPTPRIRPSARISRRGPPPTPRKPRPTARETHPRARRGARRRTRRRARRRRERSRGFHRTNVGKDSRARASGGEGASRQARKARP